MRSSTLAKRKTSDTTLRYEALLILDKQGAVLEIAREVSRLMDSAGIPGFVIGGVAVVLHGHLRTTKDVDILATPPLEPLADLLTSNGFTFDRVERAFFKRGVPVRLVRPEEVGTRAPQAIEIEGITTETLADLIEMKLRSGSKDLLRAQDLADVIGLIRHHKLRSDFARFLDTTLRVSFRKLVRLIAREKAR